MLLSTVLDSESSFVIHQIMCHEFDIQQSIYKQAPDEIVQELLQSLKDSAKFYVCQVITNQKKIIGVFISLV